MQVAHTTHRFAWIFSQDVSAPQIELQLIAKLPPGTGDFVIRSGMRVQEAQPTYQLAFEEPSALCVGTDPERDDWSAAYTFAVTEFGIEFHQHAGPRIITAITGSAGCTVSLSTCDSVNGTVEPRAFVERMVEVIVPADTQFILKLPAGVFHRFSSRDGEHCALFGVSVHPNETCGLEGALLDAVCKGDASIGLLTVSLDEDTAHYVACKRNTKTLPVIALNW